MGTYDVNVNDCDLKVRVVDHAEAIVEGISELRTKLCHSQSKIVGMGTFCRLSCDFPLLQLCVDNRCLVVVLSRVSPLPRDLTDFLDEPSICFVSLRMDLSYIILVNSVYDNEFHRGMDVRELAARVLKKPDLLQTRTFKEVAAQVGICFDGCGASEILKALSSETFVFSSQQVKCLARFSHATYLIGKKLLNMLN